MADFKVKYGSWTAITIGLDVTPLASDTSLLAGRESTVVDNTTNLYVDALCGGFITTGTSPTADRQIEIWVYGDVTGTTTYPPDITGSDANASMDSAEAKRPSMALACVIGTNGTSDQRYGIHPFSIARLFGGIMPQKWGLWVVHDTGVALNTTAANHSLDYIGIHGQSV